MLMGIQVVLAVFIIPFASGTITEYQIRVVLLGAAADRAFMFGAPCGCFYILPEVSAPFDFLWRNPAVIPGEQEEHQDV